MPHTGKRRTYTDRNDLRTDFLVIGSGIAGLHFALNAAEKGDVTVVTKKKTADSNTNFAQGGIAAVLDAHDNFSAHVHDTLEAGAFHNNKKAVEFMVKKAPAAIQKLIDMGVRFEREKGKLKLTREGGHYAKRIVYVGDYTGKEIEHILIQKVQAHPRITVLENACALDLIVQSAQCKGALILRRGKILPLIATATILATGGIGQLFLHTTNPKIATGDGLAMALRAGAQVKDLEFIQFHPTALARTRTPRFLISETVRGEGGILRNARGEAFMKNKHPLADLAPRSSIAQEIFKEQAHGTVYLDIRHKSPTFLKKRFPQIYETLKTFGIDMAKDLIPVTPAAHYLCGGIVTDLYGKTSIPSLYAFGEVTCTGVHGANRLASNSLLEALVFSNQIIKKLPKTQPHTIKTPQIPPYISLESKETKTAQSCIKEIQTIMWRYAGIVRNPQEIKKKATPAIHKIENELQKIQGTNTVIAEVRNMAKTSLAILNAATQRKTSLGCHYVED